MGKIQFESPVHTIRGQFSKDGMISRTKKFRNEKGTVIHETEAETYKIQNPRNYDLKPATGAELAHIQMFGEAAKRTTEIMKAANPANHPTPQQVQTLQDYKQRFEAQLQGAADEEAPLDAMGTKKHYYRLDNFIRAMIYHSLKRNKA